MIYLLKRADREMIYMLKNDAYEFFVQSHSCIFSLILVDKALYSTSFPWKIYAGKSYATHHSTVAAAVARSRKWGNSLVEQLLSSAKPTKW